MGCFPDVSAIDVGNEPRHESAVGLVPQRLIRHRRTEVRPTDTDVDDVTDRSTGVAGPRAAPDAVTEVGHLVENGVHLWDDVDTVHLHDLVWSRPHPHVQYRSIFGHADLF